MDRALSIMAGRSRRVSNSWLRGRPESGREFRGAGSPAPIPDEDERRLLERMHVRAMPVLTAMLPEPPFRLPNTRVPSRGTHTPRYLSRLSLKYDAHCGTNRRSTVVTCARWSACEPKVLPLCQTKDGCCAARRLETKPRGWTGSRNRATFLPVRVCQIRLEAPTCWVCPRPLRPEQQRAARRRSAHLCRV